MSEGEQSAAARLQVPLSCTLLGRAYVAHMQMARAGSLVSGGAVKSSSLPRAPGPARRLTPGRAHNLAPAPGTAQPCWPREAGSSPGTQDITLTTAAMAILKI